MLDSEEKTQDLNYGFEEEIRVLPVIRDYFNRPKIQRNPDRYGKYDFYCDIDDNTMECWELKSRKFYSTNFKFRQEGCLINTDKFHHNTYILFNFIDGLYCYTVQDNDIATFKKDKRFVRERNGGCASNEVSYVPFTRLKLIHAWPRKCLIALD